MGVALCCRSNFSFLEGASHPEELVEAAHRLGLRALALCDRNGLYGVVRAHQRAQALGLQLVIGAQVSVSDGSSIVLLVQDRVGYANLCKVLSIGCMRSPKGQCTLEWFEIAMHATGLIALWGGTEGSLGATMPPDDVARCLQDAFGERLYALITRHLNEAEKEREARIRERARRYGIQTVAATEVLYHARERQPLQDILTCIRCGVALDQAGRRLKANAEHGLKGAQELAALFEDVPEELARAEAIARSCTFSLKELRYRYPSEHLPNGMTTMDYLKQLCAEGARKHYGGMIPEAVTQQLAHEFELIESLDYGGYFLSMREIVDFCRERGILCQGRGSAANSAVCFCLGITAVDPVRMGLLFERFISAERAEPPDIDLDIAHQRREEVIQHVYEKYGRSHAAMVAVVITYKGRLAVREVGKALGLPETELGRLAKFVGHDGHLTPEKLALAELKADKPVYGYLMQWVRELVHFPRHLSIHPGGFLLGHQPVNELVPIENGAMRDRTVIQWDKNDVEALGLFKVDLLGLGALTHLSECFALIQAHRGITLTMATVPAEDPATYAMLGKGDSVGVFQVESRAQMAMLPRLKPKTYYDLVIEISLVRPGPITGGMVHPYLRRRNGEEAIDYALDCLRPVLEKTLGVPLFQEQVMKLAMVAADYTPGEADQLRRDMAAWRKRGSIARHRKRLIERMQARGVPIAFAERVFKQIEGFGDYGFPEAHAASFALITYIGAYLKCHYPAEFTCALLNAQPMGFYSVATIVEDARRHQVTVRPLCINQSGLASTLEPDGDRWAIRMGLRHVKGLSRQAAQRLRANGPYDDLKAVLTRSGVERGDLLKLAQSGACHSLGCDRRSALWQIRGHQKPLFDGSMSIPEAMPTFRNLSLFEAINWDYQHAAHSTRGHPLGPLREQLLKKGLRDARGLMQLPDQTPVRYAGLVICRQRPGTASGVVFLTLEDETGFMNLVVWPGIYERHKRLIKTVSLLGVSGKLQVKHGVTHLIATRFWRPEIDTGIQASASRDFR